MSEGQVVLITGGARGIGAAAARLAASRGYAVAVNYQTRSDAAEALVDEIRNGGGQAAAFQADVAAEADVNRLFAWVDERFGRLDALVNSAGIMLGRGFVADFDIADLNRLMSVNVIGTMLCCREAARRMSKSRGGSGGSIVNVSSMAATTGGRPGSSAYAASKGAIDVFSRGFAREVGKEGIRVNVVRPGMTRTEMTEGRLDDPTAYREIASTIAMDRVATAEEAAAPIVWLLSAEASFVSGAMVDVSGGGFVVGGRPTD